MNIVLIYTIKEADSGRSIAAFLMDSGYSSRLVVHLRNTEGSFLLNGKTVFSNTVLQPKDQLRVHVTEKKTSDQIVPVPMDLSVVFEDEHVLVIDKPAGMPVHRPRDTMRIPWQTGLHGITGMRSLLSCSGP